MEINSKLYENDSYIREFEAKVVSCVPEGRYFQIRTDRSAFFPEGGGQSSDTGLLGTAHVLDVQEKDGLVFHKTDAPLNEGSTVTGKIDWARRFSNMQQHSGEHIISGIVHRKFGYSNVGFHLSDREVTLDFSGPLSADQLLEIENEANQAVFENRKVTVSYPSKEMLEKIEYRSKIEIQGQVRLITIDGYDVCACCAPHVAATGEIGLIKIIGCQKYKGGVRLNILCGVRALENYRACHDSTGAISAMLSVKPSEVTDGVKKLQSDIYKLKGDINVLTDRIVLCKLEALPKDQADVCIFEKAMDAHAVRRAVNAMAEAHDGFCGVFVGDDHSGYRYSIGSRTKDAREAVQWLQEAGVCRGGGSRDMIQGRIEAAQQDIEAAFANAAVHNK